MPDPLTSDTISTKQVRIAKQAKQSPGTAFRALFHHIDLDWMREAFRLTRKSGAVGVDGQTGADYARELDANLTSLLDRVKRGVYRAPPVRRVNIPKGDGSKTRPIGIPTFEDKVLQRAVVMLLEPIYEGDFYPFSYGFRPGRSAHDALRSVDRAIWALKGGWVVDLDIQGFFDALDHGQLREMLRERVLDGVVIRLIGKWLRAGVEEDGCVRRSEMGTPQGGVISPLLANLYLHVVLDRWWATVVVPRMGGRLALVRYADDAVMVFTRRSDVDRMMAVLPKRFGRFGLTLHPDKTKLVCYKRPTQQTPPTETFQFLGFTHFWAKSRRGYWVPKTKTAPERFTRTLKALRGWIRDHRHLPMKDQSRLIGRKLIGVYRYWQLPGNARGSWLPHHWVRLAWQKWLSRRSQRKLRWDAFARLYARYPLPFPPEARRGAGSG
jgi:RNA-directed DNA polymerase